MIGPFRSRATGLLPAAAILALAGALMAVPATAADVRNAFDTLDEDGDGVVTREEFERMKMELFFVNLRDFSGDMALDREDTRLTAEAFDEADVDGNGRLSGGEFVRARFGRFETYDADQDDQITFEEFETVVRPLLR